MKCTKNSCIHFESSNTNFESFIALNLFNLIFMLLLGFFYKKVNLFSKERKKKENMDVTYLWFGSMIYKNNFNAFLCSCQHTHIYPNMCIVHTYTHTHSQKHAHTIFCMWACVHIAKVFHVEIEKHTHIYNTIYWLKIEKRKTTTMKTRKCYFHYIYAYTCICIYCLIMIKQTRHYSWGESKSYDLDLESATVHEITTHPYKVYSFIWRNERKLCAFPFSLLYFDVISVPHLQIQFWFLHQIYSIYIHNNYALDK